MATAKEQTLKILDTLPDGATFEDVQYAIYVRERIDRGRLEADEEKLLQQDDVETRMERWHIE